MSIQLMGATLPHIASALARQGLDLLSGVFRGDVDEDTVKIADMIAAKTGIDINDVAEGKLSEQQWAKLKEFELTRQSLLLEYRRQADLIDLQENRLPDGDRQRARDLQPAALAAEDPFIRRFVYIYSLIITLLTFGFIYYAAFFFDYNQGSENAVRVIDTVVGFLLGVSLSAIIQYFFGSSAGSKSKEEKLKQLAG